MSVAEPWQRIRRWLDAHAPATAAAIRPPAAPDRIERAVAATNGRWPDQLVELLGLADGTEQVPAAFVLPGQRPLAVAEIVDTWRMLQEVRDLVHQDRVDSRGQVPQPHPPGAARSIRPPDPHPELDRWEREPAGTIAGAYLRSFVPFTENGSGDYLCVDVRPGDLSGCALTYYKEDADMRPDRRPSLRVLLKDVATALETGGQVDRWRPVPRGGQLAWEIAVR